MNSKARRELDNGLIEDVYVILAARKRARAENDQQELYELRWQEDHLQAKMMQWGVDVDFIYFRARQLLRKAG